MIDKPSTSSMKTAWDAAKWDLGLLAGAVANIGCAAGLSYAHATSGDARGAIELGASAAIWGLSAALMGRRIKRSLSQIPAPDPLEDMVQRFEQLFHARPQGRGAKLHSSLMLQGFSARCICFDFCLIFAKAFPTRGLRDRWPHDDLQRFRDSVVDGSC
jgi:hypothetical protein